MAGSGASLSAATSLRRFADRLFEAADEAGTADTKHVALAGVGLEIEFATEQLFAAQAPALQFLPPASADPPDVRLQVLAADSCGPPPRPPWPADAYRPRDEIAGYGDERLEVAFHLVTGTLMVWDAEAGRGVWWTRSAASIPSWERAMPLRNLIRWALRAHRRSLTHGAVIGRDGRYALLAGASGAGKSTLALAAALDPGWSYLADDHCVVDPETLHAYPITCFAKATARTLALLPELAAQPRPIADTPEGKAILCVPPHTPAAGAPLTCLLVPHVSAEVTAPTPIPAAAAMAALAPTTLLQFPGSRALDRELLGNTVRGLPTWSLPSGPSLPATLRGLASVLEQEQEPAR